MKDEQQPDEGHEPGIKQELQQMFQLGEEILRTANSQIENHLSKTVDNFKTNQVDSWQELYDQLVDKYGERAVEWKDAALAGLESQVSRLDTKPKYDDWVCFESYHEVEAYLKSVDKPFGEPEIREWVMQGKSWISVREGRIYLDPNHTDYPPVQS